MDAQTDNQKKDSESKSAPQSERVETANLHTARPLTAKRLDQVEREMSGFERSTLRWAKTAVMMSALAATLVYAQWWEMHSSGRDTHDLAVAAGKEADKMQEQVGHTKDLADKTETIANQALVQSAASKAIADSAKAQSLATASLADEAKRSSDYSRKQSEGMEFLARSLVQGSPDLFPTGERIFRQDTLRGTDLYVDIVLPGTWSNAWRPLIAANIAFRDVEPTKAERALPGNTYKPIRQHSMVSNGRESVVRFKGTGSTSFGANARVYVWGRIRYNEPVSDIFPDSLFCKSTTMATILAVPSFAINVDLNDSSKEYAGPYADCSVDR